jgi:sensor histidine kinase YesM
MKSIIDNVDGAYDGNRQLMEIRDKLDSLQLEMQEYINSKDENILNKFYNDVESYKELIDRYKHVYPMTEMDVRENSLYNMSDSYVMYVNQAVLAKKTRNIEKYQNYQTNANKIYEYMTAYMTDLNNTMFHNNSLSYKNMLSLTKYTEIIYIVILLLTGGLDICVLLLMIKRLTEPLRKLADTATEVGNGNLDVMLVESSSVNEIGIVNRSFNQMVISLKDYIEKFRKSMETESALREQSIRMETAVKDAQLKYLQAQINPHFLFNTLNAGAQLAMMENADKTYKYIHKVADFFRFKIKQNDHTSSIGEELKIVDDYIYIINVRYSGELVYNKNVDESLLNVSIPGMILQPIVENCIKHGFPEVEWEKRIDVSVTEEDDNIVISVRDNGLGMPAEVINRIMNNETSDKIDSDKEGGIGIDNVIMRMRNFYNSDDVIEITSVGPNMGTEVALFIPKDIKEKQNV